MLHATMILIVFLVLLIALAYPLSAYMARVFQGQPTWPDPVLQPVTRGLYRVAAVDVEREQGWQEYAVSLILFTGAGTLLLYLILRLQGSLPLNPADLPGLRPALAANTALSFSTTTTWQAYGGEAAMSSVSQMVGLTAQNVLAGAAGLAAGVAFIRGLVRQEATTLGNFWVDLTRATLWVLLPIALVLAFLLASQGVIATLEGAVTVQSPEGVEQVIPRGPVAAMVAVNNLGTNGGGFFNANGAHPFEDPSPLTNLLEKLAIALIPAALVFTFGRMGGRLRLSWTLFGVMSAVLALSTLGAAWAETAGNPRVNALGLGSGPNLEGKETRLGVGDTVLALAVTAGGSTGSLVASNDSLAPLSGVVVVGNLSIGGVSYGGLGSGLYTIVIVVLIAAFIGGQMVGRSPQFLGKKLEQGEMTLALLFLLLGSAAILPLTALASVLDAGTSRLAQTGPHGLTALLVAYSTNVANNGQGFGSFGADTNYIHATTMAAMTVGRFLMTITALAIAGRLASRTGAADHVGTLPTHGLLFGVFTFAVLIVLQGLTFLPAIALGPILEHLSL